MQISGLGGLGMVSTQNRTASVLGRTGRELSKILEKLATSQRINRASDDAAGLSISEQLRTQIRGFKMATQNVGDGMSALSIAEGAANETSSMLQRQRELAIQASNDTLTDDQRKGLDVEYQQITQEIDRLSNATQFNSQPVGNSQGLGSGTAQIQTGPNAGDQVTLPQNDMSAAALGISGASIATRADAQSALATADTAIDRLNSQRTNIGAVYNRFESTTTNLGIAEVNTQAAESVLRDQDMAQGMAELVRNQLLQETGTKAFVRYNQVSANHLLGLLGAT